MITCESQVTLQSQIASTRLQYSMAGQVFTATECVPQVVQVSDRPSPQEEFMDFCTSPLPLQVFVNFIVLDFLLLNKLPKIIMATLLVTCQIAQVTIAVALITLVLSLPFLVLIIMSQYNQSQGTSAIISDEDIERLPICHFNENSERAHAKTMEDIPNRLL